MWTILLHYGIPVKIVNMIKTLYEGFSCQVLHQNRLTDKIEVSTGVRQGCLLSPILFLIVLDWVTRTAYADLQKGIQWSMTQKLEDLEFADDLALLTHRLQDMQGKLSALQETAEQVGLKISGEKTKLLRTNNKQENPLALKEDNIEDVQEFVYLGSIINNSGGTDEDIRSRIRKAQQSFAILRPVWKSTCISKKTKLRIFNSNVKSVLLYGSETWKRTKSTAQRLQVFVNKCLKQILGLKWFDKVPNETLWTMTNQQPIDLQIKRRKWRWVGHTLRKDDKCTTKRALDWNPQGKRKRGRPRQTWRRSLMEELKQQNATWDNTKRLAKDRERWRMMVEALCSTRSEED